MKHCSSVTLHRSGSDRFSGLLSFTLPNILTRMAFIFRGVLCRLLSHLSVSAAVAISARTLRSLQNPKERIFNSPRPFKFQMLTVGNEIKWAVKHNCSVNSSSSCFVELKVILYSSSQSHQSDSRSHWSDNMLMNPTVLTSESLSLWGLSETALLQLVDAQHFEAITS